MTYMPIEGNIRCNFLDCIAGIGLGGRGVCSLRGAWWMRDCPNFTGLDEWRALPGFRYDFRWSINGNVLKKNRIFVDSKNKKRRITVNKARKILINYLVGRIGAEKLARYIIEWHMTGYHLSKNPKKRISDEVMETRVEP